MKKTLALLLPAVLLLSLFGGCVRFGSVPVSTAEPSAAETASFSEQETAESRPESTEPETLPPETVPVTEEPASTESEPASTEPEPAGAEDVHPMLFHVTGPDGAEMYLFGTIHVGDGRMDVALDKLAPILEDCGALAVEFDIVAYEKRDTQTQMQDILPFILSNDTTIEDYMPPEMYAQAYELLQQAKLYPSLMKHYNLAMWAQLVESAALQLSCPELNVEGGMDRHLITFCYEKGIEVRDVESPELQYGLLASFSDELYLLLIENTLDNLDTYGDSTRELYEAWLSGDYDRILALVDGEDEEADETYTPEQLAMIEDYNYRMLDERNLGMRDRALEWLAAGDKVFFAVGAAHLVGDAGLVTLLREAGYTVEQIRSVP